MPTLGDRLQHAWNAFFNRDQENMAYSPDIELGGMSSYYRPDRVRLTRGNDRSIVTSVINRIAIDVASIDIKHVRLDDDGRFSEEIDSGLNNCLSTEANLDQTGRALVQDIVMSMLDEGVVAVVPVDTTLDPKKTGSYDILSLRTGKITEWFPEHVRIELYNQKKGRKEEIILPKKMVAIIENPLYSVMNEPNSTARRLSRTLAYLDRNASEASSGKLDMIISLPYVIKTQARKEQANQRRKDIEMQLSGSKYGIAYTDGTEKITQLNRSLENNLLEQAKYLTNMFFNQLGMTENVFNGTANEAEMLNYNNRTVEPLLSAITEEMERKFLTKTARSQHQAIRFFRDAFKLVPVNNLAEIADKFTRNEILSSNEIRAIIGMKPSDDPNADELRNKNLNQSNEELMSEGSPVLDDGEPANASESAGSSGASSGLLDTPLSEIPKYDINL